jgi:probable DNA metabolism protein
VTRVSLRPGADLAGFRDAARRLIAAGTPPEQVSWSNAPGLFDKTAPAGEAPPLNLPRAAVDLARLVICHSDPERHALLYRLLWRLTHGEPRLLGDPADPLVHRLGLLAKSVRRDIHKMHAFVRFRRLKEDGRERFIAWFEPDHHILDAAAPFFVDRFRALDWTILTPAGSLRWDGGQLIPGPPRPARGRPRLGRLRGGLDRLLRERLQPRPAQPGHDARGDAEEILAQPSRGRRDSRSDPRRTGTGARDDREGGRHAAAP